MGILMKCLVSFTYKEGYDVKKVMPTYNDYGDSKRPIFYTWWGLEIASWIIPTWNDIAQFLTGFPQSDIQVKNWDHVYPGEPVCKVYSPHAVWHEESANLLLEITFMCDYIYGVLEKNGN